MAPQPRPETGDDLSYQPPPPWADPKWSSRQRHDYPPYERQPVTTTEAVTTTLTVLPGWIDPATIVSEAAQSTTLSHAPKWPKPSSPPPEHTMSAAVTGAAGAMATLAFLCVLAGGCLFFCRRNRKKRRAQEAALEQQEMIKRGGQTIVPVVESRAYAISSTMSPPSTLTSPSTTSAPLTQNEEEPVLLSTNLGQNYYTGIDTSDVISLAGSQPLPSHDASYAASITEPPPPYRPLSIVSRDNSCRHSVAPPSYRPRLSIRHAPDAIRSPFDDPDDDSPVSEVDESEMGRQPSTIRDMEEMSDVSEISYQQEPTVSRPTL